ncbi:hypothetical protein Syun_028373 [Stephania yunnanensis]|uniref:Uncharacterized protein n=1 Tax=Stephania yunnanensis TaxID=152371 RepID=A0AAP0HQS6_9MAGN
MSSALSLSGPRLVLFAKTSNQNRHSFFVSRNPNSSLSLTTMIPKMRRRGRRGGLGGGAVCSAILAPSNLRWVSAVSSAVLMLSKGTAIQKSFLVPLFALQAPASIVSWVKGEYGAWTAFFALLVRLFYFIPGELELPFMAILLLIVAPYQVMSLRNSRWCSNFSGDSCIFGFPTFLTFGKFAKSI